MATIETTDGESIVGIHGRDRLFTLRSRLAVPLEPVAGASSAEAEARRWRKGLRFGTNAPGLTAGAFYHHDGWVFWDVHDPARALGIDVAAAVATIEAATATART